MILYSYLFIIFMIFSLAAAIFLLARMGRVHKEPGAYSLMWAILCLAVWSFTYIFEIITLDVTRKIVWLKAEYLGIAFICLAIFLFGLVYSGRGKWLTWTRFGLLAIVPTLTLALAFTNEYHELIWAKITTPPDPGVGPLDVQHGLWFNVHVAYSYGLTLLTMFFFVQIAIKKHGIYRLQAVLMLVGLIIPWIGNILYIFHLTPIAAFDWTPLAFTLTVVALEIGFTRYRLVEILPVAESSIMNAMMDAVLVVDSQQRIIDMNPAAERVFGQTESELIGQNVRQLFPEWNAWIQATTPRSESSREIRLPDDPERRIFNLRLETITSKRGAVTSYLALLNNVTKSVNALSQMRLLVAALEAAKNGVVITDRNGMVQWVNPAFTELTGYERNEIIGRTPKLLKSGKHSKEFYDSLWGTILAGEVWHGELINRHKDGHEYFEEMTITPLFQPDESISNFIAVKQDVSERKRAEDQLKLAHQEALEANRLKTQLLASVSHDLRTPLGTIMGYAEMLQMNAFEGDKASQKTALSEILDSANTLLTFINNLIGQAQIETGKVMINLQAFEPAMLIDSIHSIVNYHITKKNLTFDVNIDPELPDTLQGDIYWLRQILLNLVNNAVKFTETGGIQVRMLKADETHWALQVQDTGIGVPPESQQLIFEVFQQADNSAHHRHGGSGLGLSIVKQLATLMNGTVDLDSEVGKGSTFTVTFPLKAETAPESPA